MSLSILELASTPFRSFHGISFVKNAWVGSFWVIFDGKIVPIENSHFCMMRLRILRPQKETKNIKVNLSF